MIRSPVPSLLLIYGRSPGQAQRFQSSSDYKMLFKAVNSLLSAFDRGRDRPLLGRLLIRSHDGTAILSLYETYHTTMKRQRRRKVGPLGQTSSAYATITDLPNELVEKIVEDLDDNGSICRLSLTCKRFHIQVLPVFFSRNKLENLQNGFVYCPHPVPELLEAIRIALFVRNLSTLTFYFTTGIEQVISDISSLRGLLVRIPPVGTIVLGLPEYIGYPQTIRNIERWARAFLKLLDAIAKSGCRDLRLLDPISHLPNLSNNLYVATPPPRETQRQ